MPLSDWGTVTVGRLTLRENFTVTDQVNANTGGRAMTIAGEESSPPLTLAEVKQRREDLSGLLYRTVPVIFSKKADYNGWYMITDLGSEMTNWTDEVVKFSWTLKLDRLGAENVVDLESRAASVVRSNNFSQSGERWHAPPAGATGYFTGTAQPSGSQTRNISDGGTITVYRGVPANVSPRYYTTLANYGRGRVRVLVAGVERLAEDVVISASAANWELSNGLVRVTPASGASATLTAASWSGSAWQGIDWSASVTGASAGALTTWDAVSIVRNDYEVCVVRLLKDRAPGRTTLDLTLRRGSRFVETYLQTDTSTTLAWFRAVTEAGTAPASAGYQSATANDAAGNRYIIGSAKTFTANANGGLSVAASRVLDAYIGSVVGGSGAAAGDVATVLQAQYILVLTENVMAAVR